jgi:hypothetical protein
MGDAQHNLIYDTQAKLLKGGSVSFCNSGGERRTIEVRPLRTAYLFAATGYAVPGMPSADDWRHGKYMGASWTSVMRFDMSDPEVLAKFGIGSHTLCRLELDTGEVGFSDVENSARNYPRYGV